MIYDLQNHGEMIPIKAKTCPKNHGESIHPTVRAAFEKIRELFDDGEMTVPVSTPQAQAAAAYDPTKARTIADLMRIPDICPPPWEFAGYNGRPLTADKLDCLPKPTTTFEAFPVDAFPPGLREYCLEVARYANADPSIPALTFRRRAR